jgi:FkbM family methyltransferase
MELTTITHEEAVGYMRPNLESLKEQGINIETVLDIGAAHGHFSGFLRTIWPNSQITAIECNERNRYFLDHTNYDVRFVCLGDKPCKKDFHINPSDIAGGGSSFYKENTSAFDQSFTENKDIVTLDSMKLGAYDLIKIDTQGTELDIINGGLETIKQARFLLMELSFLPYNHGGCMIDEVLAKTRELGFVMLDTFGPAYGGHWFANRKVQVDVLLVKANDSILNFSA